MEFLVSVILPVYNSEKYICESILSVLNQTYSNFELIIIDDCSNDSTPELISSFQDIRLRVIHNPENVGPACSLNRGIEESSGEYIAIMHADDVALSNRLELQLEYFRAKSEMKFIGSSYFEMNNAGEMIREVLVSNEDIYDRLSYGNIFCHPTVMFHRSIVDIEKLYTSGLRVNEDYECWLRLAGRGVKMDIVKTPLIFYRLHVGQQSQLQKEYENQSFLEIRYNFWVSSGRSLELLNLISNFSCTSIIPYLKYNNCETKYDFIYLKQSLHKEIKARTSILKITDYFYILFLSGLKMFNYKTFLRLIQSKF